MKTRIIKSIYFHSILLIFITILPLYFVTTFVLLKGYVDKQDEYLQDVEGRGYFVVASLEREIENIIADMSSLINMRSLNTIRKNDGTLDFETAEALNDLKREMLRIKDRNALIEESQVIFVDSAWWISSQNIQQLDYNQWEKIVSIANSEQGLVYFDGNDIFIILTPSFSNRSSKDIITPYYLYVKINKQKLAKFLEEHNAYELGFSGLMKNEVQVVTNPILEENEQIYTRIKEQIDTQLQSQRVKIEKHIFYYVEIQSKLIGMNYHNIVSEQQFLPSLNTFIIWIVISTLLTIGLMCFYVFLFRKQILIPIKILREGFRAVETGNLDTDLIYYKENEFGYIIKRFNLMRQRLKLSIKKIYEAEIHIREAELKQLEYQINPHFLYNSFFVIYRMAKADESERIVDFAFHLGNYYKFVTKNHDEVDFELEFQHIMDYLRIQEVRFGSRIHYEIDEYPLEFKGLKVPKLILQPFLENVYKYAFNETLSEGVIKINFCIEGEKGIIYISDNGCGMPKEKIQQINQELSMDNSLGNKSGIFNVNKRLKIKYGDNYGVELSQNEQMGITSIIKIKLVRRDN